MIKIKIGINKCFLFFPSAMTTILYKIDDLYVEAYYHKVHKKL